MGSAAELLPPPPPPSPLGECEREDSARYRRPPEEQVGVSGSGRAGRSPRDGTGRDAGGGGVPPRPRGCYQGRDKP